MSSQFVLNRSNQLGLFIPPDFPEQKSGSSLKLKTIWDGSVSLASQLFGLFGKRPTTQVVSQGGKIVPLQPTGSYGTAGQMSPEQIYAQQLAQQQQQSGVGAAVVKTGGNVIENVAASFGLSTGVFMGLTGLALYLFLREPGRRR